MIRIATDSATDLPAEFLTEYGVSMVPINIQFGTETYEDGVDLDRATFYRKIEELKILPTSSQPSVGQFVERYKALIAEGATDIISIHVTAKLSGTLRSAELAKQMLRDQVRIHTFDSACGSAGIGFMVLEAARMAQANELVPKIMARLETIRQRMTLVLTLEDLRFAQMSGRVGRLQSSLSSLLNIKPLILLEDGVIDVVEKVRSRRKAIQRMLEMVAERVGTTEPVNLAIVHADVFEESQELLEQAKRRFNCQETFVENLTTTLLVHFGPGTLAVVAYRV
ncbi:MAG: DegV family protein [Anaerolineae bacterium]|jgi:DegV family protein with EDD domain